MQPLSPGIAVQQIVLSLILVGHIVILPPDVCLQPTESIMTNVQIISWIFQQYSNDQCIPIFIAKFNAVRNKQYLRVPSCLCSNCSLWFQSKERGTKNHTLIPFSCGQHLNSSLLVFCSETKRRQSTTSCHWSAVGLVLRHRQTCLFVHVPAPFTWCSISLLCLTFVSCIYPQISIPLFFY